MDLSRKDLLSTTLDFCDTSLAILESDDLDIAAKKSQYRAAFYNSFMPPGDLSDVEAYSCRLLAAVTAWFLIEICQDDDFQPFGPPKRDYRLIDAACLATYKSIELVTQELDQTNAYRHFSSKKTVKSLCRRVLAKFDLFCKNLSIESSFDAANLRSLIQKAADLAKKYIYWETDQIPLPEDRLDITAEYVLGSLFANINCGKQCLEDRISRLQLPPKSVEDNIVGLDSDLLKIKEQLQGNTSELKIIPIVGMGGIGKTTLTRRIYEDQEIMNHFHVRAWTVVSQKYQERDVFLGILQSIAPLSEEVYKEDKEQLAERLYRRLKGWKYFIVLDDIWTVEAWDHTKLCFPDDKNGSRIVITTRITQVASHVSSLNSCHFMNFLDLDDSWDLLCKQVFGKEVCPPQLVNVGKKIAEKCQGLPLAIKVLAGHLSNISKKQESWEDVAASVGLPTKVSQMESLLSILSLSYNYLPEQLKACFLTMITFPKNFEVPARKLVALWAAMGFLHSTMPNTKEQLATQCLEDLIGRSLIIVKKRKFDGEVKLCGVHDLLWDLGIREARKEGKSIFGNTSSSHSYFTDDMNYAMGLCNTLRYFDYSLETDCPIRSLEFKLITVLDILNEPFDDFPNEITELVNLKYLYYVTF